MTVQIQSRKTHGLHGIRGQFNYIIKLGVLTEGSGHCLQVVICNRSSGGLFVKIKSRLWGKCLAGPVHLPEGEHVSNTYFQCRRAFKLKPWFYVMHYS